jgi:hypothetical protein
LFQFLRNQLQLPTFSVFIRLQHMHEYFQTSSTLAYKRREQPDKLSSRDTIPQAHPPGDLKWDHCERDDG